MNEDIVIAYVVGALMIIGSVFLWRLPRSERQNVDILPFIIFCAGVLLLVATTVSTLQRRPRMQGMPQRNVETNRP